jgi:hypothetical protein
MAIGDLATGSRVRESIAEGIMRGQMFVVFLPDTSSPTPVSGSTKEYVLHIPDLDRVHLER